MREKSWKYIVTFQTTTAAMAFESLCAKENVPGRLIPVPKELSSGCGLAWCVPFGFLFILFAVLIIRGNVIDGVCGGNSF